jgi:Leucine-rich repeat (LRR) protein
MGAGFGAQESEKNVIRPLLFNVLIPALLFAAAANDWIAHAGGAVDGGSVSLRASWVTDSDMPLLAHMPGLTRLDLSLTRISDPGLRALRGAPSISDLNLSFAEQIGDDGVSALRDWKHLRRLNLRGTKITDAALETLAGVKSLESLDVGYAQLTDAGPEHLTALANLRRLSLGGNKLTAAGLQFLREEPRLSYLDISGTQRTDSGLWSITLTSEGVEAIATVTDLVDLNLGGTAISAGGLKTLASLPRLERLTLQNCKRVGHDAVPVLSSWTRLRWLDVAGTQLTPEDVAALKKALPECRILSDELLTSKIH